MTRTNSHFTTVLATAAAALAFGCGSELDEVVELEGAEDEAAIVELAGAEGPEIDDLRKSLSVPVTVVHIDEDGTKSIDEVTGTAPGVPDIHDEVFELDTEDRIDLDLDRALPPEEQVAAPKPSDLRTVFGTDDRYSFHDHSYPYRTVGKVNTSRGSCSGTLVGPRHLLTASHCITWNSNGSMGWLRFQPSMYSSHSPYGEAWASRYFVYLKNTNSTLNETEIAFDFVLVVLDRRIGDTVGWMGSTTYSSFWNHFGWWANIGYPSDFGGSLPTFQNGCSVYMTLSWMHDWNWSQQLFTQCDIVPGQSGGPLYGYFSGSPLVVGVTSAESSWTNFFSGGSLIPSLINYARAYYP